MPRSALRQSRGTIAVAVTSLVATLLAPVTAVAAPLGGGEESTLQREPQLTPQEIGDGSATDLLYADPTEGLSQIEPPTGNSGGSAQLEYPLTLPKGRGMTPELALSYDSSGASSWAGLGWDISVGDISVDTEWGVPLFCPRDDGPACGNVESESYLLDGEALMPSAVRTDYQDRVPEREDFTRRVETEYERIIRHGSTPENYFWEVRDKSGNVRWYGGYPDGGGPTGDPGTRHSGRFQNDGTRNASAILTDDHENGFRWYLSAMRDVGVNMFRYEYDTVTYQNVRSGDGTAWQALGAGADCPNGRTCAKHVYLKSILYTGASEASGHDEDPPYEVRFVRSDSRPDPVLDARGGFLDLDQERLDSIEVRYVETDELITKYDLEYERDRFGKSKLVSVTQTGCAHVDPCDATTAATHTFAYYDDVETAGGGFASTPATWDTGLDNLANNIYDRASALGMSQSNGGDGHVYLGFNGAAPSKTGSFGGSITVSGGQTDSLVEFLDINGDSLPDKVFEDDGVVKYRLNAARPEDEPDDAVSFVTKDDVAGRFDSLPVEREFGITGGVEAYMGVVGVLNVGGEWSFADGYFTDANADGLPDYVVGGTVYFNSLVCTGGGGLADPALCKPTFQTTDNQSRVPLDVDPVDDEDESAADTLQMLRELAPPVDTVRRWVAPYAGWVEVSGVATLEAPPYDSAAGSEPVWVSLQRNEDFISSADLVGVGAQWDPATTLFVGKGARLYFRTSSRENGSGDDVDWNPTVTYTAFSGASLDANGLRQDRFEATADFTLAGRPGSVVTLDTVGTAHASAAFEKGATTDDVTPSVLLLPNEAGAPPPVPQDVEITPITNTGAADTDRVKSVAEDNGEWCVTDPSGGDFGCYPTEEEALERLTYLGTSETGRFRFEADIPISPLVNGKPDAVQTWLSVDSPIDVQQITWVEQPVLCYLDVGGMCDQDEPIISPPVDIDVYPANDLTAPAAPWEAPRSDYDHVRLQLGLDPHSTAGQVVVTIKDATGYVYKERVNVPATGALGSTFDTDHDLPGVTLSQGTDYWIDVSTRAPGIGAKVSSADVTLLWTDDDDNEQSDDPSETFNWTGEQTYFPVSYRGWGLAGYRSDGNRGRSALHEGDFRPGPPGGGTYEDEDEACDAQPGGCLEPGDVEDMAFPADYPVGPDGMAQVDLSMATDQVPEAFAYVPTLAVGGGALEESWQLVDPEPRLLGTATTSRAGRFGDLPAGFAPGGAGLTAPSLWGAAGPTFSLMGGIGPLSGSFAFGWSSSTIDYMDMNGDGFPDIVTPSTITFTNPRGGRACISGGAQTTCQGDGPDVVQMSTTIGLSGGLEGAPIGISANTKGRTNGTQGNATNKGGDASDKTYAGDLGLSIGYSYSWTNPNSPDPDYQDEAGMIPGDPQDAGLATEQVLADINGDGLPDRVTADPSGVFVRFNLGYGFSEDEVKWSAGGFESGESASGSLGLGFSLPYYEFSGGVSGASGFDFSRYAWADVNGDGLLDALHKNATDVDVAFGTGTGVGSAAPYGTMQELEYNVFPLVETDTAGEQIRQDQSESLGGGADVSIYIPLCAVACYLVINPGGHYENSLSVTDIDLVDVNGDGAADSVSRIDPDSGDNHEQLSVRLNTLGRTGLLEQVTTPMGGTIDLDYDRKGNTLEHPDSRWVLSDVQVHSSLADDGISDVHSTYDYGTPRYAFVQREDLGFDRMVERQLAEDGTVLRTVDHEYLNGSVFESGLEVRTAIHDGDLTDRKVQQTETDWQVQNLMTGLPLSLAGVGANELLRLRGAPQVRGVTQVWYDDQGNVGQETSIRYEYDGLGNPVVIDDEGDTANSGDDVVAQITYSNCEIAQGHGLRAQFGCGDGAADAPHENPTPDDPDDPWDDVDTPPAVPPAAAAPYWTKERCATWTSVPVIIEVRDADNRLMRYRDGAPDVCDNTSVTYLKEMVEAGTTLDDATYAVTRLAYDDWGSYNRIAYPPDEAGQSYAVFYVYDDARSADIASVTDLSLDADQVDEFIDNGVGAFIQMDPADPVPAPEDAAAVGITASAEFDGPTGRVSSRTDASGNTTTYEYDALSRIDRIGYPGGGEVTFDYAPSDPDYPYAVAHHSDEFNADTIDTATFVAGNGEVTGQKRDATFFVDRNSPTVTGWSVAGASLVDELGRTTRQWYPTQQLTGSLTDYWEATPPDLQPIRTEWDALDRITKETAANDAVSTTAYGFDSLAGDRMSTIEQVDPLGRTTLTFKDAHDNVRAVDDIAVDLDPVRTTYQVDALGQLHSVRSSPTELIEHSYDLVGQRLSTTTPDGGRIEYEYDLSGNLITEQSSVLRADNDSKTHYSYEWGHLVETNYPDATPDVTFTWGGYGGVDPGDNGAGRVVGVVDAARDQTLGYDENGRVDSETTTMLGRHPNNGPWTTEFDYDFLGRLADVALPDGETVINDYDAGAQLSSVRGEKPCTALGALTFAIDATQTTITVTENPTTGTPPLPFTIWIGSEQLEVTNRVATAFPDRWTYTVVRGVNGSPDAPTNTSHAAGASVTTDAELTCSYRYLDRREYDEFGSREFQSLGNDVWTEYTRNAETRRLEHQLTVSPAAPNEIQDLQYTYDLVGNLRVADNAVPADVPSLFGGPVHQEYDYDGRYRIKHAEGTWDFEPKTRRLYTYDIDYDDVTGNMTSAVQRDWTIDTKCRRNCKESVIDETTFDHSTISYASGSAHRYDVVGAGEGALDYTHDLDGNVSVVETADMIRTVQWDAAGRMASIVDHNKNGTGRKVTTYRYDYNGNLALEMKEQGESSFVNPWVTVRNATMWKHIWADDDRLATKFSQADAYEQKVYYLHKDLQGSTHVVTDRVGKVFQHHEYFPSGQVWVDEASTIFRTPYQFAGGYVDEDHDLVNMGQRWYDPAVQAFNSVDPILASDPDAIVAAPELRTSYAYGRNNPLTNVDVDGRKFSSVHVDPDKALALVKSLQIDGKPLSSAKQAKLVNFFNENTGLRGRMAMYWLGKQKDNEDRQAFAELLDTKPMLEFEFTDGKLSAIKLGLGVGKRKKFDFSTPDTSAPAQNPAAPNNQPNNPAANPAAPPNPNAAAAQPAAGSPPATGPPNQQDSQTSVSVLGGGPASPPSAATNDAVKGDSTSAGGGNP